MFHFSSKSKVIFRGSILYGQNEGMRLGSNVFSGEVLYYKIVQQDVKLVDPVLNVKSERHGGNVNNIFCDCCFKFTKSRLDPS